MFYLVPVAFTRRIPNSVSRYVFGIFFDQKWLKNGRFLCSRLQRSQDPWVSAVRGTGRRKRHFEDVRLTQFQCSPGHQQKRFIVLPRIDGTHETRVPFFPSMDENAYIASTTRASVASTHSGLRTDKVQYTANIVDTGQQVTFFDPFCVHGY